MNAVREWSTIICLATIVCTMLEFICPNQRMEKMVKLVLSAFLLCAIISPLTGTISKISFNLKSNSIESNDSSFKNKSSSQAIDIASENIRALTANELDNYNINPKKIDIFMDTNDVGSISMIKMKVYLKDRKSHLDIKKILENKLGIETDVIYGSE